VSHVLSGEMPRGSERGSDSDKWAGDSLIGAVAGLIEWETEDGHAAKLKELAGLNFKPLPGAGLNVTCF
jgi:hypothetical protein